VGPSLFLGSSDTPGVGAFVRSSPSASLPGETAFLVPLPPLAPLAGVVAVGSWNTHTPAGLGSTL
jgi:hypothetical protein